MSKQLEILNVVYKQIRAYDHEGCAEFKPGTNIIIGENGAGKSTLVEIIGYTLFRKLFKNNQQFKNFNYKGNDAYCGVDFMYNGSKYSVISFVDKADMKVFKDNKLDEPVANGVTPSLKYIEELLGFNHEYFTNCIYTPQRQITNLVDSTAAIRLKTFDKLTGLWKLQVMRDYLSEVIKTLPDTNIDDITDNIERINADLEQYKTMLDSLDIQIKDTDKKRTEHQQELDTLLADNDITEYTKIMTDYRTYQTLQNDQTTYTAKIETLQKSIATETETLNSLDSVDVDIKAMQDKLTEMSTSSTSKCKYYIMEQSKIVSENNIQLKEMNDHINKINNEKFALRNTVNKLNQLNTEVFNLKNRIAEYNKYSPMLADVNLKISNINKEITQLNTKITDVNSQIASKQTMYKLYTVAGDVNVDTNCPLCDHKLTANTRKSIQTKKAQSTNSINSLMIDHQNLICKQNDLNSQLTALNSKLLGINNKIAKADITNVDDANNQISKMETEIAELNNTDVESRINEIDDEINTLNKTINDLNGINYSIIGDMLYKQFIDMNIEPTPIDGDIDFNMAATSNQYLIDMRITYENEKAILDKYKQELEYINNIKQKIATYNSELSIAQTKLTNATGMMITINNKWGGNVQIKHDELKTSFETFSVKKTGIENMLNSCKSTYDTLNGQIKIVHKQEADKNAQLESLETTYQLKQRDGLLRKKLEFCKDLLHNNKLKPIRHKLVTKINEELLNIFPAFNFPFQIQIDDEINLNRKGSLSGAQEISAALAVKLAFRNVYGDHKLVILDEPTSDMDAERVCCVVDIINQLSQEDGQNIIISHKPQFKELTNVNYVNIGN